METGVRTLLNYWLYKLTEKRTHTRGSWRARARDEPESFSYGASGCNFLVAVWRTPEITFLFLKTTLTTIHTLIPSGLSGSMCVWVYLVPRAQSAQPMETGEGREADWLSHPLQRERQKKRERERETRKTGHGWEVGHSNAHRVCLWRKIPCSSRAASDGGGCR